ncbi:LysM peptidoglycan-binding domain-containing protein [Paenibacillus thermoaerophilus]|nr:LysM peptidoglycan-binding domain-containing protein [Paenibacillus thermoaerophilus]
MPNPDQSERRTLFVSEQPSGLRFDIYERVHLDEDISGIHELEEIELSPDIQVEVKDDQAVVQGKLVLSGRYYSQREARSAVPLAHEIPVEITLPLSRVPSLESISVEIENFDVDLVTNRSLNVTGILSLSGIELTDSRPQETWQEEEVLFIHQPDPPQTFPLQPGPPSFQPDSSFSPYDVQRGESQPAPITPYQPVDPFAPFDASSRPPQPVNPVWWSPPPPFPPYGEAREPEAQPLPYDPQHANISGLVWPSEEPQPANISGLVWPSEEPQHANAGNLSWTAEETQPEEVRGEDEAEPDWELSREEADVSLAQELPEEPDAAEEPELSDSEPEPAPEPASAPASAPAREEPKVYLHQLPEKPKTEPAAADPAPSREPAPFREREIPAAAEPAAEAEPEVPVKHAIPGSRELKALLARAPSADERAVPQPAQPPVGSVEWKKLFLSGREEPHRFRKLRLCIVQKEDTLDSIASKYQLKPQELSLFNRLSSSHVEEGQILYIP